MITKEDIKEYRKDIEKDIKWAKKYGIATHFDKNITDEEIVKILTKMDENMRVEIANNFANREELIKPFTSILDQLNKYVNDITKNALDFSKNDKTDKSFEDVLNFMTYYTKKNNRNSIIVLQEELNLIKENKEISSKINRCDLEVAQALIYYFQDNYPSSIIHFQSAGKAKTVSPWAIDTNLYYLIFVDLGILEEMKKYEKKANTKYL